MANILSPDERKDRIKITKRKCYLKYKERNQPALTKASRERVRERKELLVDYKGGKCSVCGYDKCIAALDFHHISEKDKLFTVGNIMTGNLEKLKKEADKCILICANCHRELHYNGK